MTAMISTLTPCLWFDNQAEEAAKYYTGIFPNSRIRSVTRYGKAGFEVHHQPEGSNILFASGEVKFVPKDQIPTLRWKP